MIALTTDIGAYLDSLSEKAERDVVFGLVPLAHFHKVQTLLPGLEGEHKAALAAVKDAQPRIRDCERAVKEKQAAYDRAEREHGPIVEQIEKKYVNLDFWREDQKPAALKLGRLTIAAAREKLQSAKSDLARAEWVAEEAGNLAAHIAGLIDRLQAVRKPTVPAWWPG